MNISVKMTNATNAQYHGVSVGSFVSMDVEEYLRGVVPVEMNPDQFPLEALRVQAIAARTFALYMNAYNPQNLTDTSSSAQSYSAGYHKDLSDTAIYSTEGSVVGYSGKYALSGLLFCGECIIRFDCTGNRTAFFKRHFSDIFN